MATYSEIVTANAGIVTTNIRGKEYADVAQRVIAFRKVYPQGTIRTEMVTNEGDTGRRLCVFRAVVGVGDTILGTGTAYEMENTGNINRTSYIENCETSAVGRALGFAGFGIAGGIASAEEVARAQDLQSAQEATRRTEAPAAAKQPAQAQEHATLADVKRLEKLLTQNGISLMAMLNSYHVRDAIELTPEQCKEATEKTLAWAKKQQAARKQTQEGEGA